MSDSGVKFRLAALAGAVALAGALIVLTIFNSQRQAAELRAQLSLVDSDTFRIADHFKESLRDLTDKMLRYRTSHDPVTWQEFENAGQQLDVWIDKQKPKLETQQEKELLRQMDRAYDEHMRLARDLRAQVAMLAPQTTPVTELSASFAQSTRHLFDLGQNLAKAHFESRNDVVSRVNHTLTQLRLVMLGSLGLLFAFGIALGAVVYRDLIAPLRVKVVESEALLERHEKLASLGMLAAGVAHEIRNPLTAIKAALFVQQKRFQPGSAEQGDAAIVEREMLRLERIVNDFLEFARPAEPELATVLADLALREVQLILAPQFAKANIQILVEESEPLRIKADLGQIKQVLLNLAQNAADAIGRDGLIKLRARHDRKKLGNGEMEVVVLEVTDTGHGIPPEVEKRLFDPFFTTKDVGTGLGLSIAARIVQNHGGTVQYHTQVNEGTTFGVVLPEVIS